MLQTGVVDGQKVQLDINKHGDGMMILVILLVRRGICGRSRNRETQVRRSIYKQRNKLRGVFM